MTTLQHLFVYGTLKRAGGSTMHQLLARHAAFVGEGTCQGRLFRIDFYPGAVPSDNPKHQIRGEVYALPEPDLVLPRLDRYEECGAGFPEPTEYIRVQKEIRLKNGQNLPAWIYLYNLPTRGREEISSGNFAGGGKEGKGANGC